MRLPRNILLVGPRGAGKSTVGRLLAERLGWPFIDTDEMAARHAGATIREIFERQGEAVFRAYEASAIAGATEGVRAVISVGGGAVLSPGNRARLRRAGLVVWLTAELAELERRITADPATAEMRPALTPHGRHEELAHLLAVRDPLYAETAALTIDTTGRTAADVADAIVAHLQRSPDSGPAR